MASPGYRPPWDHEFREGLTCLFCKNAERPVLAAPEATAGICEACAVNAHWIWRTLSGDSAPVDRMARVTRVKVLVSRLAKLPTGEEAVPEHPESYEIAMVPNEEGNLDLPTADVADGESELQAVEQSLAAAGISTWRIFVEPLYAAYTPRGSLTRIYVVRAYVDTGAGPRSAYQWRGWPPWKFAKGMEGLYLALEDVWPLLIAKHLATEPRTSQITTLVRKGAAEYLRVQQALREGSKDVDTSMLEYLRKAMTDDEKLVCKQVQAKAELSAELAVDELEAKAESVALVPYKEDPETTPDEIVDDGGPESLDDAFAEGGQEEP